MMWFVAYSKKEGLGIEHRGSISKVLYGISILGSLKRKGLHMDGFQIFLLSGSYDIFWQNRILEETSRREVQILNGTAGRISIIATTQGYMQLRRMRIPENQLVSISEKEVYKLIKAEGSLTDT